LSIFSLGYGDGVDDGSFNGDNTRAQTTLINHGNWDVVTGAIQWSNNIPDRTIPDSYYLASKPAFFGSLAWPAFNPTNPSPATLAIPAQYRYFTGTNPPAGVANQAPIANASASATNGPAPLTVNFSSVGSFDPEGAILTYLWSFGDGGTSTASNPSHTYSAPGNYSAQLSASDGTNTTTSSIIAITVLITGTNQAPTAAASAKPTSGVVPLSVNFSSAGSSDPDGTSLTFNWAFGDGGTSSLANPTYTYQSTGTYSAVLTVSDGTNSRSAAPIGITVVPVAGRPGGPVAAYGFEEGNGTTTADASGNGNIASITGATWTTGRFGKALTFNGNSVVSVPDSSSLDLTTNLTLEAWVYISSFTGDFQPILIKPLDAAFSGISYALQGASRSTEVPSVGLSIMPVNLSGPSALSTNTWSHLAATYDGSTVRLYLNGVQVGAQSQTGLLATSTQPLTIGMNWTGIIDEVRIYNRALDPSEIQGDMTTGVLLRPSAPTNLHIVGP